MNKKDFFLQNHFFLYIYFSLNEIPVELETLFFCLTYFYLQRKEKKMLPEIQKMLAWHKIVSCLFCYQSSCLDFQTVLCLWQSHI